MTNTEETDATESHIVRASVLESHGWSSEPNCSQCKLGVQEINSLVFCYILFFLFVSATPFFILRDKFIVIYCIPSFPLGFLCIFPLILSCYLNTLKHALCLIQNRYFIQFGRK